MSGAGGTVGPVARLLGVAGLLPQILAVLLIVLARSDGANPAAPTAALGRGLALIYAATILSFLGGMWWGFAMRRGARQARLVAVAVMPSLVGAALVGAVLSTVLPIGWSLVLLGSAVLLTLPVDRHLAATGEAPTGWMRLRVPLSIWLGGLTIVAGVLAR